MRTATALKTATEALIGFAATHPKLPGSLPCPDTNNDGSGDISSTNCVSYIGRLPWKQLGLSDLRDGYGECLWYALSPVFRTALPVASRTATSNPINTNTPGALTIYDSRGSALAAPTNPVVAIVFSPGPALSGQDRTSAGSTTCGGNSNAAAYLDTAMAINNATGNGPSSAFITGATSATFNDQLAYITSAQLFGAVNKRVLAEVRGLAQPAISGLRYYYDQTSPPFRYYPWAANAASLGAQVSMLTTGLLPYADLSAASGFDTATQTWLTNNGWYPFIAYQVSTDFAQGTLYPQQCGAGCLTVNGFSKAQAKVSIGTLSVAVCSINANVTSCPYP